MERRTRAGWVSTARPAPSWGSSSPVLSRWPLVGATHPQPPWAGPELFARSFHPIQVLPYPGGIFLVAGLVLLLASIHAMAERKQRTLATAALVFTAVFAALIFFNYVVQTAFIPVLAAEYTPSNGPLLAACPWPTQNLWHGPSRCGAGASSAWLPG